MSHARRVVCGRGRETGGGERGGRGRTGLAEGAASRAVFRAGVVGGEVLWRFRKRMVEGYVRGSRADGGERRRCCEGGQCERRWWDRDCGEEGRLMKVWRARCGGVSGGEFSWDGWWVSARVVHGSDGPAGRVGSGHDFAGFWRVGSAFRIFKFFTDYFLVPESIRILDILHSD